MSSYMTKARNRKTGIIHEVFCWDDYYGNHAYGYQIDSLGPVLTEEQYQKQYEEIKHD